jgi:hypothetical protein
MQKIRRYITFQQLFFKTFAIFAVCPLLTIAMAPLIHNATNNLGGATFSYNEQSAPAQNTKATVDETKRQADIRRLSIVLCMAYSGISTSTFPSQLRSFLC